MMITKQNIKQHELIGLTVDVQYNNATLHGEIIDETKNTITLQTKAGEKTVIKKNAVFTFHLRDGDVVIKGEEIVGNPWDRIKPKHRIKTRWEI